MNRWLHIALALAAAEDVSPVPRSPARVLSTTCTCLYAGAFVAPIKRRRFRFARSRRRLADVCCEGFSARYRIGGKRSVVGAAVGVWQAKDRGDRKCPRALVAKRTEVSKERNWCGWPGGHEATGQDPTHDHNSTKTKSRRFASGQSNRGKRKVANSTNHTTALSVLQCLPFPAKIP